MPDRLPARLLRQVYGRVDDALGQPVIPAPARLGLKIAKFGAGKPKTDVENPLAAALTELGPTYIKLGQFLATRPDLVGADRAACCRKNLQISIPNCSPA